MDTGFPTLTTGSGKMKTIAIFLVVFLTLSAESVSRTKKHNYKLVKNDDNPGPMEVAGEDGDMVWSQPDVIKNFEVEGVLSGNAAFGDADDDKGTRHHGKSSRKSHVH